MPVVESTLMLSYLYAWLIHAMEWTEAHAASVQALSAVAVAILTYFLVRFTRSYVGKTEEALKISSLQLQVMREQVDDQKRAFQLSKEQHDRDILENHREDLNTRVLEPLLHALEGYSEPEFRTNFSTQQYRANVSADENPVVTGPILSMSEPGANEQNSLDSALFEDARQHHHRILLAGLEHFNESWYLHRENRRKWIREMADRILDASALPAHGSTGRNEYVMNLSLAMFVYDRLVRKGAIVLKIGESNFSDLPVLTDGTTQYALGPGVQIITTLATIDELLKSERQRAKELQKEWSNLDSQRTKLFQELSLAIATKTLPVKCPLVSLH
jgi:hypothetical protein